MTTGNPHLYLSGSPDQSIRQGQETVSLLRRKLPTTRATPTAIAAAASTGPGEQVILRPRPVVGVELPPFRQVGGQLAQEGLGNVFADHRKEFVCTRPSLVIVVDTDSFCGEYSLSSAAGRNKDVLVFGMAVKDEIARRGLVVPAETCLLKAPRHQLG